MCQIIQFPIMKRIGYAITDENRLQWLRITRGQLDRQEPQIEHIPDYSLEKSYPFPVSGAFKRALNIMSENQEL